MHFPPAPQTIRYRFSPASTTVSATHPSRPVDQVIEFGDNIFAPASGDVGFFLDNS